MANALGAKTMTNGEAILWPLFAVLAFLCLIGAGFAHDAPFAFHASLACVASTAASFLILNRYYDRPAELQSWPDQICVRRGDVLGHRGFHGRPHHCLSARLAGTQSRSTLDDVRPPAAAAHIGGGLRVRWQRPDRDLVLRGAEDLPHAASRRLGTLVRRARL